MLFHNLLTQNYVKKNLSLAWPLALNALLMQSMLMIDTLLVSPLGEISLAAMGIATTIVSFVLGIQMALANGSQLVLSRAVGSGNFVSVNKSFWAGIGINFIVALLCWLLVTIFEDWLIHSLSGSASLVLETQLYLNILKYIILFNAISQVMIALFNAFGKTKVPFKGYLVELPINISISYLLIHGTGPLPSLGLQGAAIGSLIAIAIRVFFLYVFLKRASNITHFRHSFDSSIRNNVISHFKETFPVAANVTVLQAGATIYMLLFSQLPLNAYVAITIIMPWVRAGMQFVGAWANSSAITISNAIGSKSIKDLRNNVNTSIDMAVAISVFSSLFFLGLSFIVADVYPDLDQSTYTALASIAPLYIILPIVRGYNTVHGNVLRALGKTTEVFKINFAGQWIISIPICALIILGFDGSIFWAFAIFPFEEMIKALPFRQLARRSLTEFDMQKAKALMYD